MLPVNPLISPRPQCNMAKQIILNASPKWPDVKDDFIIRQEGRVIGRVRLGGERYAHGNTWEWSITIPMEMPVWASGSAEGRDACMKEFTVAWSRLLKETSPERLKRAFELERTFAALQKRMRQVKPDPV